MKYSHAAGRCSGLQCHSAHSILETKWLLMFSTVWLYLFHTTLFFSAYNEIPAAPTATTAPHLRVIQLKDADGSGGKPHLKMFVSFHILELNWGIEKAFLSEFAFQMSEFTDAVNGICTHVYSSLTPPPRRVICHVIIFLWTLWSLHDEFWCWC